MIAFPHSVALESRMKASRIPWIPLLGWSCIAHAGPLSPSLAPGQNLDLSSYRLQTLDEQRRFREVEPVGTYQDAYFFTDGGTGEMMFRVPSGAGHSANSEYPRVELRESGSWMMDPASQQVHAESIELRVMAEPATGSLIFAQIHGEKAGGSEALKLRWLNGDVVMGVKQHYRDPEQRIPLLRQVPLGAPIDCRLRLVGDTVSVEVSSGTARAARDFQYAADSWRDIPVYFKVGNYSQDRREDGSTSVVAVRRLTLTR